jgi:hypothetical protein
METNESYFALVFAVYDKDQELDINYKEQQA